MRYDSEAVAKCRAELAAAKSRAAAAPPHCCENCGRSGVNLLSCAACRCSRYCSRECQRSSWPAHKRACKDKVKQRISENTRHYDDQHISETIGLIPRIRLALAPSLTGYSQEVRVSARLFFTRIALYFLTRRLQVLIDAPAWDVEAAPLPGCVSSADRARVRKSTLASIKLFFKRERVGDARFNLKDIFNVGQAAVIAVREGYEGVRFATDASLMEIQDPEAFERTFSSVRLSYESPIPPGWVFRRDRMHPHTPTSPAMLEKIAAAIEHVRGRLANV